MINQLEDKLKVKFNSTEYTKQAFKWRNDNFSLTITTSDYIYLGFKKQLWQFYFDIQTANTNTSVISAEKYDGSSWVSVDLFDETEGLTKSGHIFLDKEHGGKAEGGDQNIYIRLKVDSDTSAVTFRGIGLTFCSMDDLLNEEPNAERFYPRDFSSHIKSMEAATTWLVRKINTSGKYKYDGTTVSQFTRYDLLNINELREPCAAYALHKIMSNRADGDENDNYRIKAQEYLEKAREAFKGWSNAMLSLDLDDDGILDDEEVTASTATAKFIR